jgi:transketolase
MRGAVRLAALSGLHVVYVWTHDSVGLGEDGPTHQPVEQYAALRAIPGLWFVRPGDPNETAAAWRVAVERRGGPVALALTRQKLPTLPGTDVLAREGVAHGGYVLREASPGGPGAPAADLILVATGSELALAVGASEILEADGIRTRVVSLPCWELFDAQDEAYRESVLPASLRRRVSIEAGVSLGWERWAGSDGAIIAIDHFGVSAPGATILEHFGFTAARIAEVGRRVVRDGLHGRIATIDRDHAGPPPDAGRPPGAGRRH